MINYSKNGFPKLTDSCDWFHEPGVALCWHNLNWALNFSSTNSMHLVSHVPALFVYLLHSLRKHGAASHMHRYLNKDRHRRDHSWTKANAYNMFYRKGWPCLTSCLGLFADPTNCEIDVVEWWGQEVFGTSLDFHICYWNASVAQIRPKKKV